MGTYVAWKLCSWDMIAMTCLRDFLQSMYRCLMSGFFACHSALLYWRGRRTESSPKHGGPDCVGSVAEAEEGNIVTGENEDIAKADGIFVFGIQS